MKSISNALTNWWSFYKPMNFRGGYVMSYATGNL